ncbi:hypothetical protein RFI_00590 [Reticulomyxa filosa]|uniref:Uncharacterized protein n=1 Tax=Reticulomyxa filosa TaxID=46433 RepID=X6PFL8_RETFI|nr:hypothetical protein RFI_00590 [Reticulomyxa filosa]|eukprot:ETO36472.1 hypothetical protein RFI_00590 [Reticulomyxa filosa]
MYAKDSLKRSRPQDDCANEHERISKKQRLEILQKEKKKYWTKENKKILKDYFCRTSPSLVFTPVNGKKLTELMIKDLWKKLKAFLQSWKTLFAFHNQVKMDEFDTTIKYASGKGEFVRSEDVKRALEDVFIQYRKYFKNPHADQPQFQNLYAFENEIKETRKITEFIIIGGDWHPFAWLQR